MSSASVAILILSLVLLVFVVRRIAKHKLELRYSLLWLVLAFLMFICALFPGLIFAISRWTGFVQPSNFVLVLGIFCLAAISLSLSSVVSRLRADVTRLTQEVAMLEKSLVDDEGKQEE